MTEGWIRSLLLSLAVCSCLGCEPDEPAKSEPTGSSGGTAGMGNAAAGTGGENGGAGELAIPG